MVVFVLNRQVIQFVLEEHLREVQTDDLRSYGESVPPRVVLAVGERRVKVVQCAFQPYDWRFPFNLFVGFGHVVQRLWRVSSACTPLSVGVLVWMVKDGSKGGTPSSNRTPGNWVRASGITGRGVFHPVVDSSKRARTLCRWLHWWASLTKKPPTLSWPECLARRAQRGAGPLAWHRPWFYSSGRLRSVWLVVMALRSACLSPRLRFGRRCGRFG